MEFEWLLDVRESVLESLEWMIGFGAFVLGIKPWDSGEDILMFECRMILRRMLSCR